MSNAAATTTMEWHPRANPWLIALAVMLATFMVILDTSISVVALPYIAGNLGATQDESTWVLTSYLVANAVILPASTWLSKFFGRKRFLIACTILFTVSSVLCGLAATMPMLVISRVLQGLGGGAMQPLSQAILLESFPPAKRGAATALFGIAIVVAPILGPVLGGWLTDNWSWRWTFYINLPVGIIACFLILSFVEDPPYLRGLKSNRFDGIGFGLVALALGTLQIVLDKGQDADWFAAIWLRWFTVICVLSFIGFLIRELTVGHPLVDLHAFKNRNFAVSCPMFALFGIVLYALIAIQPLFVQTLLGYNAYDAGLSVSPRGIGSLFALFFVGALISKIDARLVAGIGFAVLGLASFFLCQMTLQIAMGNLVFSNILVGFGIGCLFIPLTTLGVGTLKNEQIGNATVLQNLIRNVGSSVGLSLVSTLQERLAQVHQFMMVDHLSPLKLQYQQKSNVVHHIFAHGFSAPDALARTQGKLYQVLLQQSNYWSFMNLFFLVACVSAVCVFGVPFFEKPKGGHVVVAGD